MHKKLTLTLTVILCLTACRKTPAPSRKQHAPKKPVLVAIQPLGSTTDKRWLRLLCDALPSGVTFQVLPLRALPSRSFHPKYRRYRAARLCHQLARWKPQQARYIVGLTNKDISATLPGYNDHAVFGLTDRGGPASVLSVYRLSKLNLSDKKRQQLWRVLVRHEWGHLEGLKHCNNPVCVMFNAQSKPSRLLKMRPHRCRRCQKKQQASLDRSPKKP